MRVLIASHHLGAVGGVQAYERDLAFWLLDRGHTPIAYSTVLGETARQLQLRTVPVVNDLSNVAIAPDVIHGDSAIETMTALLHFPHAPAVLVCHGWTGPTASPPRFPRIRRYVAVDDTCADRLTLREGISPDKVTVLLNAVGLDRFRQRGPLPPKPRRAVVFSNYAHELTHLPAIREACRSASIDVDVIGSRSGNPVPDPESILGQYDLAFAKAKCALEAMACGLPVIVCDAAGVGGMVHTGDLERMRRLNFGIRTLTRPLSAEVLRGEIARYDPDDARRVSDRIREVASADGLHESLLAIYESVIEEHAHDAARAGWDEESRDAALFLRTVTVSQRAESTGHPIMFRAAQRILTTPLVGPALTRAARWLLRREG